MTYYITKVFKVSSAQLFVGSMWLGNSQKTF